MWVRVAVAASGTGNINTTVNLLVGGTATYTVNATVSASALGALANTATVAAPAGVTDPNPNNNTATDVDTLTPTIDLSIAKVDSPDPVVQGAPLIYTLTVTNNGPSNATGVVMTDTLPAGVTFNTAIAAQGTCTQAGGIVNCAIGNLNAGASTTVSIVVTPTVSGTITNTATTRANETEPNLTNNTATQSTTVNPGVGTICVLSFNDLNQNGSRDSGEPCLSARPITVTNSLGQVVGAVTTNGTEPRCFSNLPAGIYTIIEVNPAGYTSTSPDLVTANVGDRRLGVECVWHVQLADTNRDRGNGNFTPTPTPTIQCPLRVDDGIHDDQRDSAQRHRGGRGHGPRVCGKL